MSKPNIFGLVAALRKADAAFTDILNRHNADDEEAIAAGRPLGVNKKAKAIEREEARAIDQVNEAFQALCRYRARTPEELAEYVTVLFNHWRITNSPNNDFSEREAEPLRLILTSINSAAVNMLIRRNH
jgi:hypothetical protein